jgi:hypothetical protein
MDPDETLRRIREQIQNVPSADEQPEAVLDYAYDALVEHFQALDEWLSKGGYVPRAWSAWK